MKMIRINFLYLLVLLYLTVCTPLFCSISRLPSLDDVRAEPRSWLVVGMVPLFDKKKPPGRADRIKDRMELHAAALP